MTPQSPSADDEQPDKLLEDAYRLGTTDATLGVDDHTALMPKMKAALHAYILAQVLALIGEDEKIVTDGSMLASPSKAGNLAIVHRNSVRTELRRAAQARFGNQQDHSRK